MAGDLGEPVRVERTGLALLHEGETVLPEAGSEALLTARDGEHTLVVEFPVEVEIRLVDPYNPEDLADHALARLLDALDGVT